MDLMRLFSAMLRRALPMLVVLAIFVSTGFLWSGTGRGQTKVKQESSVKPVVKITSQPVSASVKPSSLFSEAVGKNITFRNELNWIFGGKQQHGWSLYDLLIGKTLETESEFDSGDFASTLSAWQKRKGLNGSGVLDDDSLLAMIAEWQGDRLKDRTPAEPDQLLTAPAPDFYDPERVVELRQVERDTYAAYKQMLAAAIADPSLKLDSASKTELAPAEKYFKIISSYRSPEYQAELRRRSPNAGSAGLAVNSPHFTGRALDLYVGGDPVDTKDSNRAIQVNSPAYKWLVRNAGRFGFRPYFYEPWHWEYVK
jgi:D-alanyl-D-alanine carboxypeptidase